MFSPVPGPQDTHTLFAPDFLLLPSRIPAAEILPIAPFPQITPPIQRFLQTHDDGDAIPPPLSSVQVLWVTPN